MRGVCASLLKMHREKEKTMHDMDSTMIKNELEKKIVIRYIPY